MNSDQAPHRAAVFCAHFLPRDQNHVYRQVDGLPGWETRVLTWKRDCAGRFPFPDERLVELPKPWTREPRRWWQGKVLGKPWRVGAGEARSIARCLRLDQARLLHVYFGHVAVHLLPLLDRLELPLLVSFHGVDAAVEEGSAAHHLLRRVFERASLLPARSEELLGQLERLGAPSAKLRLWRAGIPLEEWPPVERAVPTDDRWVLVQACRFQDKKGLDTTLRAFASLRRRWPAAQLVLAGDGPRREELIKLALELGIGNAVEWPGFLDAEELRALYARAHFLLHPSRTTAAGDREGVPNAMLEALATGLPVAATRHGGIPEALAGAEAVLVDEDDWRALADGVARWFEDPSAWQSASRSSRRAVEDGFALDAQRARLASLYVEAGAGEG